jgi:hypothetical protein
MMAFEVRPRSLAAIAAFYRTFGGAQAPMVALVGALEASGLAAGVHTGLAGATLVLSPAPTFDPDAGVLRVTLDGAHVVLVFAEAPRPTRPWTRRVREGEAQEALASFLRARAWHAGAGAPVG